MAGEKTPRDASAKQVLDAFRALQAEIEAARQETRVGFAELSADAPAEKAARAQRQPAKRQRKDIEDDTAALERENAVGREGVQIELAKLEALRKQSAERARNVELAGVEQRLASGLVLPPAGFTDRRTNPLQNIAAQNAHLEQIRRFSQPPRGADVLYRPSPLGAQVGALPQRRSALAQGVVDDSAAIDRTRLAQQQQEQAAQRAAAAQQARVAQSRAAAQADASAQRQVASAYKVSEQELYRLGLAQSEASTQMRKHGALTTEFLSALGRGETTLAEFRYQIGATIAKFGGWTGAAAAVYGALGAVTELGKGALDAQKGVAGLDRFLDNVDTKKATQGFRDVSRELNVPIEDVATAQQNFARIFKNQDDSLTAARTAILATKLDNIDLADSYKYLTALSQEFGLSAKDLPGIFDQISAAQRKAGGKVSEIFPALARSGSAVKNTLQKGDDPKQALNELLALINTAQVSSGQSGATVGQALQRGASNFYRRADNAAILRSFGLDPDQGFTKVLISAIRKTKSLSGSETTELARALGGPAFGGRLFQSLLGRDDLLEKNLKVTSPGSASGSGAEELEHKLKAADEQLHQVINSIQRLGSALRDSGLFIPLGIALQTLNLMLGGVERLLEAFEKVPGPIRDAIVLLIEMRAVLALLKTPLGTSVADAARVPFLGASPERRVRQQAIVGARQVATNAGAQIEQTVNQAAAVRATGVVAERGVQNDLALKQRLRAGGASEAELVAVQARIEAGQQRALAAFQESARLEALAADQVAIRDAATQRLVALQKGQITGADVLRDEEALRQSHGVPTPLTGGAGGGRYKVDEQTGRVVDAERAALNEAGAIGGVRSKADALKNKADELKNDVNESVSKWNQGNISLGGALNAALIGFTVGELLKSAIDSATEKTKDQIAKLQEVPQSATDLKVNIDKLRQPYKEGFGGSIVDDLINDPLRPVRGIPIVGGAFDKVLSQGHDHGQTNADSVNDARQAAADAQQAILNARNKTFHSDIKNVGLSYGEITQRAQDDARDLKDHSITRAQFNKDFKRYGDDLSVSAQAILGNGKVDPKATKALEAIRVAALQRAGATKDDPFAAFRVGSLDDQTKLLGTLSSRVSIVGATSKNLRALAAGYIALANRYSNSTDPKQLEAVASARQAFEDAIGNITEANDQALAANKRGSGRGLTTGSSTSALLGALNREATSRPEVYDQGVKDLRDAQDVLQRRLDDARETFAKRSGDLDKLQASRTPAGPHDAHGIATSLDREIARAKAGVDAARKNIHDTAVAVARSQEKLREAIQARRDAEFQDLSGIATGGAQLRASGELSKVDGAVDVLRGDREVLRAAIKTHQDAQTIAAAQKQVNDDIASLAQARVAHVQALGDLSTSQNTDPSKAGDQARLAGQLNTAQNVLATIKAQPDYAGKGDDIISQETQINGIRLQIAESHKQRVKEVHDLALQLYEARRGADEALIEDPTARDRYELQTAQGVLARTKRSDFDSTAEYQIARENALKGVREKRGTVQQDIINEDIASAQFEHNVGKLSDDAYIAELRKILALKHVSKATRRQLLEEIYQLQHQNDGSYDLDVGNVHLPTIYEVRRAISGGAQGFTQVNHNRVEVTVNDSNAVPRVAAALEKFSSGAGKSIARASG